MTLQNNSVLAFFGGGGHSVYFKLLQFTSLLIIHGPVTAPRVAVSSQGSCCESEDTIVASSLSLRHHLSSLASNYHKASFGRIPVAVGRLRQHVLVRLASPAFSACQQLVACSRRATSTHRDVAARTGRVLSRPHHCSFRSRCSRLLMLA